MCFAHASQLLDINGHYKNVIYNLNAVVGDYEEQKSTLTDRVTALELQLTEAKAKLGQQQQQLLQQQHTHTAAGSSAYAQLSSKQLLQMRDAVVSELDARMRVLASSAAAAENGYIVADVAGMADIPEMLCPNCSRLVTKRSVTCDGLIADREPCCPLCRHPRSAAGWRCVSGGSMLPAPKVSAHVFDA
jgi:hypothetical protein